MYFIDTSRESGVEEEFVKNLVEKTEKPLIRVYTKLDLKPKIEFEVDKNIAKISSITKEGFDDLIKKIKDNLEENTLLFPTDIYTKQDMFFRISEIIREKVFLHTKEELPHSIYV
ncbi:GTP-binding protein Era [sediment metagenome]|uniref:GTP-binding protein Era n=1 Tax=sediment metagenome TaxID=749907 RepID=D9PJ96_9ZZZZ